MRPSEFTRLLLAGAEFPSPPVRHLSRSSSRKARRLSTRPRRHHLGQTRGSRSAQHHQRENDHFRSRPKATRRPSSESSRAILGRGQSPRLGLNRLGAGRWSCVGEDGCGALLCETRLRCHSFSLGSDVSTRGAVGGGLVSTLSGKLIKSSHKRGRGRRMSLVSGHHVVTV